MQNLQHKPLMNSVGKNLHWIEFLLVIHWIGTVLLSTRFCVVLIKPILWGKKLWQQKKLNIVVGGIFSTRSFNLHIFKCVLLS